MDESYINTMGGSGGAVTQLVIHDVAGKYREVHSVQYCTVMPAGRKDKTDEKPFPPPRDTIKKI
jgi:hypothetical protein